MFFININGKQYINSICIKQYIKLRKTGTYTGEVITNTYFINMFIKTLNGNIKTELKINICKTGLKYMPPNIEKDLIVAQPSINLSANMPNVEFVK